MNEGILTYNTPCTEEIFKQIQHYEFKRIWQKNLKKNNRNLFWGIFSIAFGMLTFLSGDYEFTGFFIGFGIATFSSYFSYHSLYKKTKIKLQEIIDKEISNLKSNSNDVIWELLQHTSHLKTINLNTNSFGKK